VGHLRLGTLPDTARWWHVVKRLADGADAGAVAAATTSAALKGLKQARGDDGLAHTVWLLAQTALAARAPDFADALRRVGIATTPRPDVLELAGAFTAAVDRHLFENCSRTDLGEMAQLAAVESLTTLLTRRSASLFDTTPDEVRTAARSLSTRDGFATLAHEFFARFARRFLTFHLGRELSNHVGGNGCFADPDEHTAFVEQLARHCREAAAIARRYAGDWYSKANFEGGISPAKAGRFADHALDKLREELRIRGARDG
jgi:hypothetical protein